MFDVFACMVCAELFGSAVELCIAPNAIKYVKTACSLPLQVEDSSKVSTKDGAIETVIPWFPLLLVV